MRKLIGISCIVGAVIFSGAVAAATCPTENRVRFATQQDGFSFKFEENSHYNVTIGYKNLRGNGHSAQIEKDGKCLGWHYVVLEKDSHKLVEDHNLCFDNAKVNLEVIGKRKQVYCGGINQGYMDPFIYNGYRLSVYAGNKNDTISVGDGQNRVFGGGGSDLISYTGNGANAFYGESGGDTLYGNGSSYGGSGKDTLVDLSKNGQLYGGSGDDTLYSCRNTFVSCGSGSDSLYSPTLPTNNGASCDRWVKFTNICK